MILSAHYLSTINIIDRWRSIQIFINRQQKWHKLESYYPNQNHFKLIINQITKIILKQSQHQRYINYYISIMASKPSNLPARKSTLEIPTSTHMSKEETKKVSQLLQSLFDNSQSTEFRQPVPWKELNLIDYPTVVQYPMDLGTIRNKLTLGRYDLVQECLDDIQLVWDNCKAYNTKGTWIFNLADKLQKSFRKMIKNYLPSITTNMKKQKKQKQEKKKEEKKQEIPKPLKPIQIQQPLAIAQELPPLSLQQTTIYIPRRQFLYRASHCTTDQMGILFLLIRNNSPHCFKVIDGKVIIESELIDDTLLKRLQGQLDMWGIGLEPAVVGKRK